MRTFRDASMLVFLACLASAQAQTAPGASLQTPSSGAALDTAGTSGRDSLPAIDSMPRLIEFIKAEYPADLVKKGIEGQTLLDIVVDTAGRVDSVAVVKGFNSRLDSSAASAARKFRFRPALAAGAPVPVIMEYVYRFTLDEVVEKIERYVNFKGRLVERGTRGPVRDAIVMVMFRDTAADSTLSVPFSSYLKKIGNFPNQHIENGAMLTTTDSLGRFGFFSLPAGPVAVKVICAGYEQLVETEHIHSAEITEVVYYIRRFSAYGDNEIVVYGKVQEKEVAKHTLTLNEVRKIPGLGGDAVKVVQALPGVARASLMSGQVVVRGASNADSRFFLDGVQLPVLFHFGGLKSTYNSDALESVDFYPGGFGVRYGDVTAGVIEIKGRPAKTDRVHATVDVNMYDASFLVEGPVSDKISMLLSGRRSYVGDILSWAVSKLDVPISIQPYYWDYIWRTDYAASKSQKFYLTLFGSQDFFKLITSNSRAGTSVTSDATDEADQRTLFHMGILGWNWDISPTIKNSLTYSLTYGDQYESFFGAVKMDRNAWFNALRDQAGLTIAKNAVLNAGLDAQIYPANVLVVLQGAQDTVTRDTVHDWVFGDIAPYLFLDWKTTERLEIIPGLRYDYYPELDYRGSVIPAFWNYHLINNRQGGPGEPSLRLTMRYKLTPAHTLKAAAGNYSQTPQPLGQAIMERWGDPHLPATKGAQYVGGWEWQMTDLDNADVQAYYNDQWDIPRQGTSQDVAPGSPLGTVPKGYYADQLGRMYGLEVLIKHNQGNRFFGWLAYSLSRSERRDPHTGAWSLYSKDETHNLQLIGSYKLPHFWEIGCRLRFVTGDPTTPYIGITYDENEGRFHPIFGGESSWVENPRAYKIKDGILKPGKNVVAIRVFKWKSKDGFLSKPDIMRVELGDKTAIPLAGEWKGALSVDAPPPHLMPLMFENYPTMPAVLYEGMIEPVAPLAIKGVIWYQGEANFLRAYQYGTLLPTLISDWRRLFSQGDFPFYIVSLPAFMQHRDQPGDDAWAELREAQALTARNVRNCGLAVTVDTGEADNIHPKDKKIVGERLAFCALVKEYGKKIPDEDSDVQIRRVSSWQA